MGKNAEFKIYLQAVIKMAVLGLATRANKLLEVRKRMQQKSLCIELARFFPYLTSVHVNDSIFISVYSLLSENNVATSNLDTLAASFQRSSFSHQDHFRVGMALVSQSSALTMPRGY